LWTPKVVLLDKGRIRKMTLLHGASRASFANVIAGWRESHEFCDFYISLQARVP
jgi:hypothetical protein